MSAPGPTLNTVAPDASVPTRGLARTRLAFRPATSVSPAGSRRSAVTMPTGSRRNPCEGDGAPCSSALSLVTAPQSASHETQRSSFRTT